MIRLYKTQESLLKFNDKMLVQRPIKLEMSFIRQITYIFMCPVHNSSVQSYFISICFQPQFQNLEEEWCAFVRCACVLNSVCVCATLFSVCVCVCMSVCVMGLCRSVFVCNFVFFVFVCVWWACLDLYMCASLSMSVTTVKLPMQVGLLNCDHIMYIKQTK